MLLTLDIGNSHIFGGIFDGEELRLRFRYDSQQLITSDQLGVFLRAVIRENNMDYQKIGDVALCSVVPSLDYSVRSACLKYFNVEPFILKAGVKTGLNIKYHNPIEVGADRIANAIAASELFPKKNLIIIDLGTATTFCAVNQHRHYLGGTIISGLKLSMTALEANTAKLPSVEILKPQAALGKSTKESLQSGLYYGHLGSLREISQRISEEAFDNDDFTIIGTGGFSHLFDRENIFTLTVPDLALHGLKMAYLMNQGDEG